AGIRRAGQKVQVIIVTTIGLDVTVTHSRNTTKAPRPQHLSFIITNNQMPMPTPQPLQERVPQPLQERVPQPLRERVLTLVKHPQFFWWLGHLTLLAHFILYLVTVITFRSYAYYYHRAYLGALLSYGVVVYKSFGVPNLKVGYYSIVMNFCETLSIPQHDTNLLDC
ncbi:hypothetical protein BC937DRAFT_90300, partial [Endogone sp. FLAS-F59071]